MTEYNSGESIVLRIPDLIVVEEYKKYLDESQNLLIPDGIDGFVFYGPYRQFEDGFYEVSLDIDAQTSRFSGTLELYDSGRTIVSVLFKDKISFRVWIEGAKALEVRIKCEGAGFYFRNVKFDLIRRDKLESLYGNGWIDGFQALSSKPQNLENLWDAIHKHVPRSLIIKLSSGIEGDLINDWTANRPAVQIIPAWNEEVLTRSFNGDLNLKLNMQAVKECAQDNFRFEANLARELGYAEIAEYLLSVDNADEAPFEDDFLSNLADKDGVWQYSAIRYGLVFCVCPFTGGYLTSNHTFVVPVEELRQSYLFIKFNGLQPFYLVIAGFGGRKSFIYLPFMNIALQLGNPIHDWGGPILAIQKFQELILKNSLLSYDYLNGPTVISVVSGVLNNLGHFLWNELSGISNFQDQNRLAAVKNLLIYKHSFVDPSFLFEEMPSLKIVHADTAEDCFRKSLEERMFLVRPTALRIERSLTEKLHRFSTSVLSSIENARIEDAKKFDVLIWFNLRAHNKVWIDQTTAVSNIANRILRKGQKVAFFLDGTPDCREFAEQIKITVPEGVGIYEGINLSLNDSISWAFACDIYIATIGSGLTLVTWIAGKPGVAHSERAHLNQLGFWKEVRLGIPAPQAPQKDDIIEIGEGAYCNYSIDPNNIADLTEKIVEKFRRHGAVSRNAKDQDPIM